MDERGLSDDRPGSERASAARMYDYFLGGAHNFAPDRAMAAEAMKVMPNVPLIARANRAFLNRAVRFLLESGVRQFLDIGSGIPTAGNVHEVVHAVAPDAPVVYVDIDPVAVSYSETLLADDPHATVLQADLRRPAEILAAVRDGNLLDFSAPIGLLLVAVLPFVADDEDPAGVVATLRAALAPGSYLALSHGTPEVGAAEAAEFVQVYKKTRDPVTFRTRATIEGLLTGWDVVEPGLVWLPAWRPDWPDDVDADPSWTQVLAAVARRGV